MRSRVEVRPWKLFVRDGWRDHWGPGIAYGGFVVAMCGMGIAAVLIGPTVGIAVLVALIVVVSAFLDWRLLVISLVAISVAVPRWTTTINALNINAERLALPVCVLVVLWAAATGRARVRFQAAHASLAIYLVIQLLASLTTPLDRAESARLAALAALATIPFWVVPTLLGSREQQKVVYKLLLALGGAEAAFGLLALLLYRGTDQGFGVQVDWLTRSPVPYGTQWEGNTFGSYLAVSLIMGVAYLKHNLDGRARLQLLTLIGLLTVAILASLSRGAWVATIVGVLGVVILQRSWRIIPLLVLMSAGMLAGLSAFTAGDLSDAIQIRVSQINPFGTSIDGADMERARANTLAIEGWKASPVIGLGAGTFGQTFDTLSGETRGWIGNLELHALHDSGLVGATALGVTWLLTMWALLKSVRNSRQDREVRIMRVGLVGSTLALLTAFQATEATWLGYPWVTLGLALAVSSHAPDAADEEGARR